MFSQNFLNRRKWLVRSVGVAVLIAGLNLPRWTVPLMDQPIGPLISSGTIPTTIAQCAACHRDITDRFPETGHARTFSRGDSKEVRARFAGQEFRWNANGPVFRFVEADDGLWLTQEGSPLQIHVDWVLGSGHHAQTPIHLVTNPSGATELWQHALSWYPSVGIAPTLGRDVTNTTPLGMAALGQWHDHATATDCLGCHATHVPLNKAGGLQEGGLVQNVSCARCHYDTAQHVARNGATGALLESLSNLSPRESINRCGECHRRADQTTPGELIAERLDLVRFAPIGLTQSPCFKGQDLLGSDAPPVRLDCVSCHDPHGPLTNDPTTYRNVCLTCHDGEKAFAGHCRSQSRTSDCLSCHMPTVETDPNLRFTDHWIRIRK